MTKEKLQKKTLSIRISTNGFCFCRYSSSDVSSLQYHYYKADEETSLVSNLKNAVEECPLIEKGAEYDIKAIWVTDEFTALPAEYDERNDYKIYYRFCFPKCDSNVEILSNKMNAREETVIFAVDSNVLEVLQSLGEVSFYTPVSILLGYIARKPLPEEKYLVAYLQDEYAIVISVDKGNARLYNIFKSDEGQNTLFYLLSIWKEQGLSQTEDTLYMCGDSGVEELSLLTGKFIKNRKRINPNKEFTSSLLNKIDNIPFDLQALILCE